MTKFLTLSTQIGFLLIVITFMSTMKFSRATSSNNHLEADMSANDDDTELQNQRRTNDFNRLRHFLLTSNAEQRAEKREQQEFFKRELIREYLQSMSDPDPNRLQDVKKRFKTYCNTYEDLMHSNWATCG